MPAACSLQPAARHVNAFQLAMAILLLAQAIPIALAPHTTAVSDQELCQLLVSPRHPEERYQI